MRRMQWLYALGRREITPRDRVSRAGEAFAFSLFIKVIHQFRTAVRNTFLRGNRSQICIGVDGYP